MIPKKIHYCWLSKDEMSDAAKKCISTWNKVMPDYELILWNTENFDINSIKFVKQAYDAGKFAFAADYIRLYAVYNEGGLYFDSDVYARKSFDDLLYYDFFSSLERDLTTISPDDDYVKEFKKNENVVNHEVGKIKGFGLQAAVFGAKAGNILLKDIMEWYEKHEFILPDGQTMLSKLVAPDIYAAIAQKYGFKYTAGFQQLKNNMVILPADYFPNHLYKTDNAYAVHLCDNSWSGLSRYSGSKRMNLIDKIKRNNVVRKLFGKRKYIDMDWEQKILLGGEYKL